MGATYGWPAITSLDLPSGGPSPPLAAMGTRIKAILNDNITFLAGVFDGNAAGPGTDDPQSLDRYGINFRAKSMIRLLPSAKSSTLTTKKKLKRAARHREIGWMVSCRNL